MQRMRAVPPRPTASAAAAGIVQIRFHKPEKNTRPVPHYQTSAGGFTVTDLQMVSFTRFFSPRVDSVVNLVADQPFFFCCCVS